MKNFYESAPLTDTEAAALDRKFLDARHFDKPVIGGDHGEDTIVYKPNCEPLLVYRRQAPRVVGALPNALPALREAAKWSNNRQARSGLMGFLDPTPREPFCRVSQFTRDNAELWESVHPLLRALDREFRQALPNRHAAQTAFARQTCSDFVIPDTCFTTVTVNADHRFWAHRDNGNLASGFGVMTVWRQGDYKGGSLIFPKWRQAVNMLCGDVLLFDGHELHGNSPFNSEGHYERISVVCYYRRRMFGAGTAAEELEKARRGTSITTNE